MLKSQSSFLSMSDLPPPPPSAENNTTRTRRVHGLFKIVLTGAAVVGIALMFPQVRHRAAKGLAKLFPHATVPKLEVPGDGSKVAAIRVLDTGITNAARVRAWHHVAEGGEVFPIALFRALKDPKTRQPFIKILSEIGFVPSPDPNDKTGLPTGFSWTVREVGHQQFVLGGFNCSACHSTQITYQGSTLHIDGAPNLLDVEEFFRRTVGALEATLFNMGEWVPFLVDFIVFNEEELASKTEAQVKAATRKRSDS